ncbi:hypothetical protein HDU84_000775 [Entophlyctis sp. JEL0112]|nr:hypothetical protein HDU84_000775 [Entophlyctis sp. JEL0112]
MFVPLAAILALLPRQLRAAPAPAPAPAAALLPSSSAWASASPSPSTSDAAFVDSESFMLSPATVVAAVAGATVVSTAGLIALSRRRANSRRAQSRLDRDTSPKCDRELKSEKSATPTYKRTTSAPPRFDPPPLFVKGSQDAVCVFGDIVEDLYSQILLDC